MKKSLIGLILVICVFCTSVFSSIASDSSKITEGDFEYRISAGKAILEKFWQSENQVITIPSTVQGYEVVEIGEYAFRGTNVQEITISEGIKTIKEGAFYVCEELTTIHLPSTLETVETMAFANCFLLNHVNLPKSLIKIDVTAFANCIGLKDLNVSEDNPIFSTENNVLFSKDMKELVLCPNTAGRISYIVPSSVIKIRERAFYGCSYLEEVTIPDSVMTIEDEAFDGCDRLHSVIIGDGLVSIGTNSFPYEKVQKVRFFSKATKYRFADYFTGAVEIICLCRAEHTYDDDRDAECNICDYVREVKLVPNDITSAIFNVSGNCISKIELGTTVAELISGINEKEYISVYNGTNQVTGDTRVGTGMIVKLMDENHVIKSVTVVVTGDTNGDGDVTITDMLAVKSHLLNKSLLTDVVATAADTSGDNELTITDFIQIKAYILQKGTIQAR